MPVILNKTEQALKKAREDLAAVNAKLAAARTEAVTFEARLNEANDAQAKAETAAREAVAVREDTITAQVEDAELRAAVAESCEQAAKAHDTATIASLREEVKDLQIKLFRVRDAVNAV